jgi:hypothetical protein
MPSSTRWRWRVLAVSSEDYGGYAKVEFRETVGGPDISSEGTLIFGTQTDTGGHAAVNAFDADINTKWASNSNGVSTGSAWVGREWPTPRSIEQISATARNDQWYYQAGSLVVAEYWDGAAWVPYGPKDQWGLVRFSTIWTQGQTQVFTLTAGEPPAATSVYQAAGAIVAGPPAAESFIAQATGFLIAGPTAGEVTLAQACGFIITDPNRVAKATRTRIWRFASRRTQPPGLLPYTFPLVNPGFETGDFTGWTNPGIFTISSESTVRTGAYIAYGNASTPGGMSQVMPIPENLWEAVDSGLTRVFGGAWGRAASLGLDGSHVTLEALSGTDQVLASGSSPSLNLGTTWTEESWSLKLPATTRSIRLTLYEEALDSVRRYDDAFMVLYREATVPLPLVNGGFETGLLAPWFQESGSGAAVGTAHGGYAPPEGINSLRVGASSSAVVSQDVAIPAEFHTAIDAGELFITAVARMGGWTDSDSGALGFNFFDGSAASIKIVTGQYYDGTSAYTERDLAARVPPGTRTVRMRLLGNRNSGTNLDAYFDDVKLYISPP